ALPLTSGTSFRISLPVNGTLFRIVEETTAAKFAPAGIEHVRDAHGSPRKETNMSTTTSSEARNGPTPVLSFSPVVLKAPGRAIDLEVRVSAPATGGKLPILLLSHGHGPSNHLSSLNGVSPLANYYAGRGLVVVQPTHLDSKTPRSGTPMTAMRRCIGERAPRT